MDWLSFFNMINHILINFGCCQANPHPQRLSLYCNYLLNIMHNNPILLTLMALSVQPQIFYLRLLEHYPKTLIVHN